MDKIRVLIADDQTLMRDGLKTILETEDDIEVVGVARDGNEALKMAEELKPDLVLMDIRMPNMNGVQCTKAIKDILPDTVILVLTTFNDEEYIVDALNYGASGYILKDIDGEKLIRSVRDAWGGGMILPSEVAVKLAQSISKVKNGDEKSSKSPGEFDFSEREDEVASMLSQGFTNKQIASALYISEGTVKNYVSSIYDKLGISDRTTAALYLKEHGYK